MPCTLYMYNIRYKPVAKSFDANKIRIQAKNSNSTGNNGRERISKNEMTFLLLFSKVCHCINFHCLPSNGHFTTTYTHMTEWIYQLDWWELSLYIRVCVLMSIFVCLFQWKEKKSKLSTFAFRIVFYRAPDMSQYHRIYILIHRHNTERAQTPQCHGNLIDFIV